MELTKTIMQANPTKKIRDYYLDRRETERNIGTHQRNLEAFATKYHYEYDKNKTEVDTFLKTGKY